MSTVSTNGHTMMSVVVYDFQRQVEEEGDEEAEMRRPVCNRQEQEGQEYVPGKVIDSSHI